LIILPGNSKTLKVYYFLFLMLGFISAGRVNAGYNMIMEFTPRNTHSLMGTIWNVIEGLTSLFATLILWFVTKNTDFLLIIGLILNIFGTMM
jgi:hypothetical protein